jgi:hypothetical protein
MAIIEDSDLVIGRELAALCRFHALPNSGTLLVAQTINA